MMKQVIRGGILFPISLYTRYSPIGVGKSILINSARELLLNRHIKDLIVCSKDGLKFHLHFPEDKGWECIYFYRNYETSTTNLLKNILKHDDIVFDVGANIGWYTVLSAKILTDGQCHAFEPVSWVYNKLYENCSLNNVGSNVFLNQMAVGNANKKVQLHTFSGLPHGHSSISSLSRDDFNINEAQMITLNEYIDIKGIDKIDLIKCDVEGAELEVLEGSTNLFSFQVPPMWLFEMNEETSKAFGYSPRDILKFLREFHDYEFYRIKSAWGRVIPMDTIYDYENGDNVLCIVPKFHKARLLNIR